MKIRSEVYKGIKNRLKSELSETHFIDLQKGQIERAPQNYPIPLPACLIELKPVSWSNTIGEQIGDAIISLYLYIDLVTDSFDGAEAENETIEILDIQDDLYEIMQGYSSQYFNPLNRVSEAPPVYGLRYVCYRVDFKTTLFETKENDSEMISRPAPQFKLRSNNQS